MTSTSVEKALESLELHSDLWNEGFRPDHCTAGEPINVSTNFVRLLEAPPSMHCYSVEFGAILPFSKTAGGDFNRPKTKAEKARILIAAKDHAVLQGMQYAFLPDCTMLWTRQELALHGTEDHIVLNDVEYPKRSPGTDVISQITLTPAGVINFNNQSADLVGIPNQLPTHPETQAMLNGWVHKYPAAHPDIAQVGSNRFFPTDVEPKTSAALEPLIARSGYNLTVKAAQISPGVTINTTTTCFLREMLLSDFIEAITRKFRAEVDTSLLSHILRGVLVRVTVNRGVVNTGAQGEIDLDKEEHRYEVIEALGDSVNETYLPTSSGEWKGQTVTEYMRTKHNIKIQKGHLPCVKVFTDGPENSAKVGWIAPEVLKIVAHQSAHSQLQQLFVSAILPIATRGAILNRDLIRNHGLKAMGLTDKDLTTYQIEQRPLLASGFKFQQELLELEARLLKAPKILYGSNFSPSVRDASWNLVNVTEFSECKNLVGLTKLAILYIGSGAEAEPSKFKAFRETLEQQFFRHGVKLGRSAFQSKYIKFSPDDRPEGLEQKMHEAFQTAEGRFPLILVLLPNKSKAIYGLVKRMADIDRGIASQCMVFSKWRAGDKAYLSNIIAKMNIKLGGVAHTPVMSPSSGLNLPNLKKIIVMGADVVHLGAAPRTRGCPSIASVVGSSNDKFSTYLASVRAQRSLQEKIEELQVMVTQRLRAWQQYNPGEVPEGIIFYRDGVAHTQFEEVRRSEVLAIQAAWESIAEFSIRPLRLTFAIVSKGHSTRFYPSLTKTTAKSSKGANVAPGLTVDQTITHPFQFDFFIQAHQAIQGTARPAHYYVLRNDLKLNANAMSAFTHMLHYANGRATKGISYAAPTYFADICCMHATFWLPYERTLSQREHEPRDEYFKRCLKDFLARNKNWNQADRPGPWNKKLDDVMFYL